VDNQIFHPGAESNNSDVEYSWSAECLPYLNTFPEPDGGSIYTSPAVHPVNCSDDNEMGEGKLALNAVRLLEGVAKKRSAGDTMPFFLAAGEWLVNRVNQRARWYPFISNQLTSCSSRFVAQVFIGHTFRYMPRFIGILSARCMSIFWCSW
jgi:hypothetical protein